MKKMIITDLSTTQIAFVEGEESVAQVDSLRTDLKVYEEALSVPVEERIDTAIGLIAANLKAARDEKIAKANKEYSEEMDKLNSPEYLQEIRKDVLKTEENNRAQVALIKALLAKVPPEKEEEVEIEVSVEDESNQPDEPTAPVEPEVKEEVPVEEKEVQPVATAPVEEKKKAKIIF